MVLTPSDQRVGVDEQIDDRLEILLRIVRQALEGELVVDDRLTRQHAERIAVGRGLGAGARADVEPAAGPVLDDEGLAETLLQLFSHEPREHVAAAAGTERDDDLHRARRPLLRRRCGGAAQPCGQHDQARENSGHDVISSPVCCAIIAQDKESAR
jgi:hypothetical protein